jgi:hypothetical protein
VLKTTLGTLLLAACAGLGGCAAPALSIPYVYASEVAPVPLGFTVEDRRPPSESESEMLSYNVANDLYGITRLGNAQVIPDRVPYLVARLKERAGNRLSGGKVTIEHFTVHLNKQAAYRKFAVGVAVGGIVGHVIQSNLDPSRPFIDTELRLTIGTQVVSSRQRINLGGGPEQEAVATAIKASFDAAARDVGAKLGW